VPLLQKQILHSATLLANEMVMSDERATRSPTNNMRIFLSSISRCKFSIHRLQTNAGKCLAHSLIDLIRARVRMIALQRFIDPRLITGLHVSECRTWKYLARLFSSCTSAAGVRRTSGESRARAG